MNKTETYQFKAKYARRLPDPVDQKKEHHIYWVKANNLPENLPTDPNPRDKNLNLAVYKDVEESFKNLNVTPYTFHLKNNGIDLVAQTVDKVGKDLYEVEFAKGEGILNGNHTYTIMTKNKSEVPDQYVLVKITTNIDQEFIPEMAGGLNTSVQVHDESLLNQKGAFDWIKDLFEDESYENKISYKENKNLEMDIRELIAIMTLFNIDYYPLDGTGDNSHPKYSYSSKAKCLNMYEDDQDSYKKMRLILKDILKLHDIIKLEGPIFHNAAGGHAGRLGYVETRERTKEKLIFTEKETKMFLSKGALYPLLAAFRWFIKENSQNGLYEWKTKNGFDDILNMWNQYGERLMSSIQNTYDAVGKNPNSLGKSTITWTSVYSELLSAFLQEHGNLF